MSRLSTTLCLLMLIVAFAQLTYSRVQYYIAPTLKGPCPMHNCITLSDFAQFETLNDTNVSLLLIPGNHSLDTVLFIADIDVFVMTKYETLTGEVIVECSDVSGRFDIRESTFVTITGLRIIGCGGNIVTKVNHFHLKDTIFQSVHSRHPLLSLKDITNTKIISCSFLSNNCHQLNLQQNQSECFSVHGVPYCSNDEEKGGALNAEFSNILILNSKFINNGAIDGGVLFARNCSVNISESIFSQNKAVFGGVMITFNSSVIIQSSQFNANRVSDTGGVVMSHDDSYSINNAIFTNNHAGYFSGVMATFSSKFKINNSSFSSNRANIWCGVFLLQQNSSFLVNNTQFSKNNAEFFAGVVGIKNSKLDITHCKFTNNSSNTSAVMDVLHESVVNIDKSSFFKNNALFHGVIWCDTGSLNIVNSIFTHNRANFGGVLVMTNCTLNAMDSVFSHNNGSIYAVSSELIFNGCEMTENSNKILNTITDQHHDLLTFHEGGAITSIQSTVTFTGVSHLMDNRAHDDGGAILAIGGRIIMNGKTKIVNNVATNRGGGISMYLCDLEIKGNCDISYNAALNGGGIYVSSSYIRIFEGIGSLQLSSNNASSGGGIYMKENSKLYILSSNTFSTGKSMLRFIKNHAIYGGAIYVDDQTNTDACLSNTECFIQNLPSTVLLDHDGPLSYKEESIIFSNNSATERGSNLFGGLLDRCTVSQFPKVYRNNLSQYNGITYIKSISNMTLQSESIASLPVKVCFCTNQGYQDCDYQPQLIRVKKGEPFSISLVAVDQVNNSIDGVFISSLLTFGAIRRTVDQPAVNGSCAQLTYNIFSPIDFATIGIYANGPCGDSEKTTKILNIHFLNCTCPIGFVPDNDKETYCECICDPELCPYISSCNFTTESLTLKESNRVWISFVNNTDTSGYIIYPNCPLDYCSRSQKNTINLNHPRGADKQCAYNRTGILCGACQEPLSLSLASSRCLPCYSHWPAILVTIIVAAIIAGMALVILLLVLNMTVAVGLINGFIFYSNVFSTISSSLFPLSAELSFPTIFITWLNLDIGVDTCFFDGLDTYSKTWIQLAFPGYIISLVVLIIIVCQYSTWFARLIGRADPVATLATLILLSYAKLLSVTITVLSFAVLRYPDDSYDIVWLPDGHVKYFQGKHIPLAIVALLIILIGIPYTLLLFVWQWIVRLSKWKVFNWTRNSKLNAFVATYQAPLNSKYRYWTGLLLIVRVILYITASVTVSANPQTIPVTVIMLVGGLLLFKGIIGVRVYKNTLVDMLHTVVYFNLLAVSTLSLYDFKTDLTSQTTLAHVSSVITLILLIGAICYQVFLLINIRKRKKTRSLQVNNEQPLNIIPPNKNVVTHSVIEISKEQ